jgi:CRP-like cAMP-binding protein
VFGELAMLGDGHRHADVVAETDAVVLSMFGANFREMQASMPVVAGRLQEIAAARSSPDIP